MEIVDEYARRFTALVVVSAAIAIAPSTAAGATSCGDGKGDVAIVGEITSLDDSIATFRVDTSSPDEHRSPDAPLPAIGASLPVFYYDDDTQFLRVGQRYRAQVWWGDGRFSSDVKTAEESCGHATLHADGSVIDTALISRPLVQQILVVSLLAPVLTVVLLVIWIGRRHRRRAALPV